MFPNWLSSWYNQQQQQQLQEPFNDQYAQAEEEEDWIQVLKPSMKRRQSVETNSDPLPSPPPPPQSQVVVPSTVTTIASKSLETESKKKKEDEEDKGNRDSEKGLSRQEKRAKARLAAKEMKKQARHAAIVTGRNNRKGLVASACLPASPITA